MAAAPLGLLDDSDQLNTLEMSMTSLKSYDAFEQHLRHDWIKPIITENERKLFMTFIRDVTEATSFKAPREELDKIAFNIRDSYAARYGKDFNPTLWFDKMLQGGADTEGQLALIQFAFYECKELFPQERIKTFIETYSSGTHKFAYMLTDIILMIEEALETK